jgi:hypothetical protein
MGRLRRFLLLLWALCFAASLAAQTPARRLSMADTKAVRAVVQAQLDAFAADDAVRAFSFASPGIQAQFQTPDNFMGMVRASYPMVYRPAQVAFLHPELAGDLVVQKVQITDQQGARWLALYSLHRQETRDWRISSCIVLRASAQAT